MISEDERASHRLTRYQVTEFYRAQARASGYYDQLKHIVEPSVRELDDRGLLDTSGEQDNSILPGLQHKYAETALILATSRCASYCRYCFRKRMVGGNSQEAAPDIARIADYVRRNSGITNVLVSGGDPFVLRTAELRRIVEPLLDCPNLTSIRFGSKAIAFYPPRFADPELASMFGRILEAGKAPVIVAHFDHVGEVSHEAERNIRSLRQAGVQFLNQAVLLSRVNCDPAVLAATFEKLHSIGVRPYYLFQARPVRGALHFQVPLRRAMDVVRSVNARLSGIVKTFKYIMSHKTGKIEILDVTPDGRVYLRYHQNKDPEKIGRIFCRRYVEGACWLDELAEE